MGFGLDRPTAAWIALGVSLLPKAISPIVDWWWSRGSAEEPDEA